MDSVPVVCLTGQVPTQYLGKGRGRLHEITSQQAAMAPLTVVCPDTYSGNGGVTTPVAW